MVSFLLRLRERAKASEPHVFRGVFSVKEVWDLRVTAGDVGAGGTPGIPRS